MTTLGKQDSTAIQQRIKKFEIFSENKGRVVGTSFNANEGKVNSRGMISPPVPPKSQKVKEAGKRIVERFQADRFAADRSEFLQGMLHETDSPRVDEAINTPDKQVEQPVKRHPKVELPGVIHTTARKNHVGSGLNELQHARSASKKTKLQSVNTDIMKEAHELNPFRKLRERNGSTSSYSTTSSLSTSNNESEKIGLQSVKTDMKEAHELNPFRELRERNGSTSSVDSQSTTSSKLADIDRMMMENINAFERNSNVQSQSKQATIDDMLFGGVNDPTPCLKPQRSEAPLKETSVKRVEEFSIDSPAQDKQRHISGDSGISSCSNISSETNTPDKQLRYGSNSSLYSTSDHSKETSSNVSTPVKRSEAPSVQSTSGTAYSPLNHNPIYQGKKRFSPDRFNVHPLLRNDIGGCVSPGTERNIHLKKCNITHNGSALETEMERRQLNSLPEQNKQKLSPRCMVTHDGSALEAEMKRKHSFEGPEASPKHAKADIATCPTTRGNGKKGTDKSDTSHNQKPLTEGLSHVNVKELMSKFSGK